MEPTTLAFLDGTLPPSAFGHEQHVRVAWDLVRTHGPDDGAARFDDALRDYVAAVGAASKYHATITGALLTLIAFHTAGSTDTWPAFAARGAPLLADVRGLLGRFYSAECLASDGARRAFLPPDRAPFPR